ncbi:hypothetical protein A0J48_002730 [Sphaerospermopsis aphanizomenoides BCCUSP55]|uniref:hypothetical protein n=1 Tax=Sphaerospermopsis aphanizomenoides TaxID=459663 RepID=UPI000A948EAC|nr:hypothetical protein [Sphaerospermopsis aphanizomenoides]MBK1986471.1 hypothetical protein [Sphaerospermopsis aphanizomenoides BCCUSP55]
MNIIICPGIHEPKLTESFIAECLNPATDVAINHNAVNILSFPGESILALSAFHIVQFLGDRLSNKLESPVIFISFSAGVVGAIIAATKWQLLGGHVKAFIAIDGWGVPLWGNFPIHRLSHDYFTHWSSAILGSGEDNFYADPPVDHLSMWRSPQTVQGHWADPSTRYSQPQKSLNAAEFLRLLLKRYKEK